jgi:hypothetical protein
MLDFKKIKNDLFSLLHFPLTKGVTILSDSHLVFGLDIVFIDHLRIVTTSKCNRLTELHTPNIAHIKSSVFTSRFLATGVNTVNITLIELYNANITVTTAHIKPSLSSLALSW